MKGSSKSKINVLPPRLTRQSEFRHVTRKGRRYRKDFLTFYVIPSKEMKDDGIDGRVGFIITEKAVKGSVRRNRVRRLMKEAVRKWWRYLKPGLTIVLKATKFPNKDHGNYVEEIFLRLCIESGIISEEGAKLADEIVKVEGLSG